MSEGLIKEAHLTVFWNTLQHKNFCLCLHPKKFLVHIVSDEIRCCTQEHRTAWSSTKWFYCLTTEGEWHCIRRVCCMTGILSLTPGTDEKGWRQAGWVCCGAISKLLLLIINILKCRLWSQFWFQPHWKHFTSNLTGFFFEDQQFEDFYFYFFNNQFLTLQLQQRGKSQL